MSAYAHQMEREYSIQSLSSRGNSELGSRYVIESGFHVTSFAAAIFVTSIITVGVLMISLLLTLSIMLQSCKSRNAGIVEVPKAADEFNYCKLFALHAELNSLEAVEFPLLCRDIAIRYIKEGHFVKELNLTIKMAESYFGSLAPSDDGLDAVLIDIDEILASTPQYSTQFFLRLDRHGHSEYIEEAKHQKHMLTLELYLKLRSKGYSLVLLSRKSERERNAMIEQLISSGYSGWSSLIMRPNTEMQLDIHCYFYRQREAMQEGGIRVVGVIGNHMDVLTGPWLGKRVFKLPSPLFYSFRDYSER